MARNTNHEHRWGVILAGGDGTRLRSLTRLVSGDDRPKQFCRLLGSETLLGRTRRRMENNFPSRRTLFVLTRDHEPFYREEMAKVPAAQMLVQPSNRGTLPAILWSLNLIARTDPQGVVAFFPSDHFYADEENFMAGVEIACETAERGSPYVTLLGVPASSAEGSYGWIEAEAASSRDSAAPLLRIKRFWEKPHVRVAQKLLERGCVWNTFVMIGRARAFLEMIASTVPEFEQSFHEEDIEGLYKGLPSADFSSRVLAASAARLAVLCLGGVGWSDLGDPQRLIGAMSENGLESPWVALWRREADSRVMAMGSAAL